MFGDRIRRIVLEQSKRAGVGHIGSALSVADLVGVLYEHVLRVSHPNDPERDRFVLSKGHAALALSAALHLKGWISAEVIGVREVDGHDEAVLRSALCDVSDGRVQIEVVAASPPIRPTQRAEMEYHPLHLGDHITRRLPGDGERRSPALGRRPQWCTGATISADRCRLLVSPTALIALLDVMLAEDYQPDRLHGPRRTGETFRNKRRRSVRSLGVVDNPDLVQWCQGPGKHPRRGGWRFDAGPRSQVG